MNNSPLDMAGYTKLPNWLLWSIVVSAFVGGGMAMEVDTGKIAAQAAVIWWAIISISYTFAFILALALQQLFRKGLDKLFGSDDNDSAKP